MPRARSVPARRRAKNRLMKRAKGYYGGRHRLYKTASDAVLRAESYAYRDRRTKKRQFRRLWIVRITAACEMRGMMYSRFIDGLNKAGVQIDRKVMSDMAISDPAAFDELTKTAAAALN